MIIITNKGLIDPMALQLMGASSKRNDETTVGFFGSGVKYALAYLMRNEIGFQLWRGEEEIPIRTEDVEMRGMTFRRLLIGGVPTSITTDTGPKWGAWQCIRELYANAIDEGGEMAVTDDYQPFITPDRTTFIITDEDHFRKVIDEQDMLFCRGRNVIYQDQEMTIYNMIGRGALYVKGIMVHQSTHDGYGYQLSPSNIPINEERSATDIHTVFAKIFCRLLSSDNDIVAHKVVGRLRREGTQTFERSMMDLLHYYPYQLGRIKISEALKKRWVVDDSSEPIHPVDAPGTFHVPHAVAQHIPDVPLMYKQPWLEQPEGEAQRRAEACARRACEITGKDPFERICAGVNRTSAYVVQIQEGTCYVSSEAAISKDPGELTAYVISAIHGQDEHQIAMNWVARHKP